MSEFCFAFNFNNFRERLVIPQDHVTYGGGAGGPGGRKVSKCLGMSCSYIKFQMGAVEKIS